jgi:hypothetical protein
MAEEDVDEFKIKAQAEDCDFPGKKSGPGAYGTCMRSGSLGIGASEVFMSFSILQMQFAR